MSIVLPLAPPMFETERLLIRKIELSDRDYIFWRYGRDEDVARYMTWPVARAGTDRDVFVQAALRGFETGANYEYLVFEKRTQLLIGGCGMQRFRANSDDVFSFGYCFATDCWGRGYATEVATQLVEWFQRTPEVFRFMAYVDVDNPASCRVLEKAGLVREGVLRRWIVHPNLGSAPRDVVMYAVVK